jgi:hypothetical protein
MQHECFRHPARRLVAVPFLALVATIALAHLLPPRHAHRAKTGTLSRSPWGSECPGRLGTPDPVGAVKRMRAARKAQAAQFAANVLPIIREIQTAGYISFNAIAGQLNARKVATANGGRWRHVQVRQILDRAAKGMQRTAVKRQSRG